MRGSAPFNPGGEAVETLQKLLETRTVRRAALLTGCLALLAVVIAGIDLQPNLARVKIAMLSGSERGNYHAIVARLAQEARSGRGRVENLPSQGSIENIERLSGARRTCQAQFALVQNGLDWLPGLELVARLPRSESVFFLGRDADRIRALTDLQGFRIGIGPEGSGTARLARELLEGRDLVNLGFKLSHHRLNEQLSLLQNGGLDLGVLVMDEDAVMVENAVRDLGLAILSLPQAAAIGRRLPYVRIGHIAAGQYDPVRMLPPTEKAVLQVDALVIGNGCASRSTTTGLLTLLARVFPDLLRHNKDTPNSTGLLLASASQRFFEDGGPDLATQHVPWAMDLMPLSNWIYAITAVSILFNLTGLWSRFRLWRIDAHRVKAEARLPTLFRPGITPSQIARLTPTPDHRSEGRRAELADLIAILERLKTHCRQQSMSWVADMGQEMPYRYQEHLMSELLDSLRSFAARIDEQGDTAGVKTKSQEPQMALGTQFGARKPNRQTESETAAR
jgi:TRAP-type uncharacterized transport system substrate-binding protein